MKKKIRFMASIYPEVNIFTGSSITPLGLIIIATIAEDLGWEVKVIDENNYIGPRDENGLPDHRALQESDPVSVVGFYCGLTSTMDRVFELSEFYHQAGVINIAGGAHVNFLPEEALDNNIDIVVHDEGELIIREVLNALEKKEDYTNILGTSVWQNGLKKTNLPQLELPDLDKLSPPNFDLIEHAGEITVYPIGRVRGCRKRCEFCSVNGRIHCASPEKVFDDIGHLVKTRNARNFFIVDDRLEEKPKGLLTLFELISEEYGARLKFTVQIRLETAKQTKLLKAMKRAGVRVVCIGYESPIAEDLEAMHKDLLFKKILGWTSILRKYFWIHAMLMFGYPNLKPLDIPAPEMVRRFKKFIRKAKFHSLQILHPVPIVGAELRTRIREKIFPLSYVPWKKYDGNFACFQPDNMTLQQLQDIPIELMQWFYSKWSLLKIVYKTVTFPIHFPFTGWRHWYYSWSREFVRYGGHRLLKRWSKNQGGAKEFVAKLENYIKNKETSTA